MNKVGPFRLYPAEQRWWSFNDYAAVLDVVRRLRPSTVLEFGPGSSTLALIEGGAGTVDCCEDDERWYRVYHERLELRYPKIVRMVRYLWSDPVWIPGLEENRYDLALIDGPRGTPNRPAVIEYCLARCAWVLACCESNEGSHLIRDACDVFAAKTFRRVTYTQTGPLSGSFALFDPPC